MTKLVLHPVTDNQINAFRQTPSHAVILAGSVGSGKLSLATQLAENLLEIDADSFDKYGYSMVISSVEGKAIGIEEIRELEHFLSLKVPRKATYTRAIIIADSHLLTTEAQNALLKTLEEPPSGTFIILTTSRDQALLPTIRSRAQLINVQRPDRQALEAHFRQQNFSDEEVKRAYTISGGLPGLMRALLGQDDHSLLQAVARARELLSQPAYERLQAVDELSRQRTQAIEVAFILQQMAQISLPTAKGAAATKWQNVLEASYSAEEALQTSAQPKLALTNLMLRL